MGLRQRSRLRPIQPPGDVSLLSLRRAGNCRLVRRAKLSATTFWIFDAFDSEDARPAHINGEIAAALMAKADEPLAAAPEILPVDVLAAK